MTKKTTSLIVTAIREGRYLSITYENKSDEFRSFWICVQDILDIDRLMVHLWDVKNYDEPVRDAKISISKIKYAEILRFSRYDVSTQLLEKLNNVDFLKTLGVELLENRLLSYYKECYRANIDPFIYRKHLITGIDMPQLLEHNPYTLNKEQTKSIIHEIYHKEYSRYHEYKLAISELSIDLNSNQKFIVAYRNLKFDPIQGELQMDEQIYFNANFFIQDVRYSLSYFTDISAEDFESLYLQNKEEAISLLNHGNRTSAISNTRPEFFVLGYAPIDFSEIYDTIEEERKSGELQLPMKAFFQNISLRDTKNRTKPNIVLFDNQVNIDQLRSIYNALKYPITYVQGPPGTGKTQTILNIVVNCFTSNKTLLITSSNNVPIDGICEKLNLGQYKTKDILFPVLRLGNKMNVSKALQKLKGLFEFETKDIAKEDLLLKLKEKSRDKNKLLDSSLEQLEERAMLEQSLGFVSDLLKRSNDERIRREKQSLQVKLDQLPAITDRDLKGIFEVIKDNHLLLQFFYFESLKYVKRLKNQEYDELKNIVYIEKEEDKIKEFNRWIHVDDNLNSLLRVFPIILTTNISSRRLGKKLKFDLLVMDESGQSDIATGLIPISKCKNVVMIGDTNQLKPIVLFDEFRNKRLMREYQVPVSYDYCKNSLLSLYRQIDSISRNILLSYHYRCGRKIINYANSRFYENKLNIDAIQAQGQVELLNIENETPYLKNAYINEAAAIVKFIQDNQLKDVFILTPFRNQENLITEHLKLANLDGDENEIRCGTIHKVQGQENATIIISTAISSNTTRRTYDWVKNNSELINVGVTRAKERLIVVADKKAIDILSRKDDDLYALVEYVSSFGKTSVSQSTANKFTIGFSNDSAFENEFYKTMSHYCTVYGGRFDRNVRVVSLFPEVANDSMLNRWEFDGVLFEKNVPRVVFEINGVEHSRDVKRIASDKLKAELLKSKEIQLITVPNQYVKHYEFLRELVLKIQGHSNQLELFMS